MIVLWLLSAHMMGDFVLSSRWQAAQKLDSEGWRLYHVAMYCVPFVPIAIVYGDRVSWVECPTAFLILLFVLHYLTDSHRFRSTLGDWVHWQLSDDRFVTLTTADPDVTVTDHRFTLRVVDVDVEGHVVRYEDEREFDGVVDLPANPWAPIPILVDQTLHLVQIAALASLLLR